MNNSNTIVSILGMHRSGTSCLAGCLEERGLHLGEVVNCAPYNIKGNKENLEIRAINDDFLSLNGGSWDAPPDSLVWNDELRFRRDECIARFESHRMWGFKDPRTLLTLPFWFEAIPNMKIVGTYRHPGEVARSLMFREKEMDLQLALDLWKHYNLKLLEYHSIYQFPLVRFDCSADNYALAVTKIADYLGLQNDTSGPFDFFDEKLRNSDSHKCDSESIGQKELSIYNDLKKLSIRI